MQAAYQAAHQIMRAKVARASLLGAYTNENLGGLWVDIVMKPFSKWRLSAILNFQILVLWSRDLYLNIILLLHIKFRVNRI